jgi:hypothetical protein
LNSDAAAKAYWSLQGRLGLQGCQSQTRLLGDEAQGRKRWIDPAQDKSTRQLALVHQQRSADMISPNMNNIDRGLRLLAGLALLALGGFGPLGWWGAIGLIPIATALIGWCPAYRLLGINTCARPSA